MEISCLLYCISCQKSRCSIHCINSKIDFPAAQFSMCMGRKLSERDKTTVEKAQRGWTKMSRWKRRRQILESFQNVWIHFSHVLCSTTHQKKHSAINFGINATIYQETMKNCPNFMTNAAKWKNFNLLMVVFLVAICEPININSKLK